MTRRKLSYDERFYLYMLSHVPELGAVSIKCVFEESLRDLDAAYVLKHEDVCTAASLTHKQNDAIKLAYRHIDEMRREYDGLSSRGIRFITYYDEEYPSRLRSIHAAPMVLYVMGELPGDDIPSVAIVGSRNCTNYGSTMTRYFSQKLAESGINIISGMAYGIDAWAHIGALDVPRSRTFAVLGCGVNICYPKENYDLYKAMSTGRRGGVISEAIPGLNPLKKHFPMRNRIISGLADAVLVMEAREKSGSLITADLALEQGRDVLALPGRVTDPMSRGCNQLIDSGARILKSPDDVIEMLGIMREGRLDIPTRDASALSALEKQVYKSIDAEPHYVQDIADTTGIAPARIISILLDLELKGYVTQVSSNYYSAVP